MRHDRAAKPFVVGMLRCVSRRCVAFGNSFNDEERCVLAGYDNGDVKMFDLRMNKVMRMCVHTCHTPCMRGYASRFNP